MFFQGSVVPSAFTHIYMITNNKIFIFDNFFLFQLFTQYLHNI